MAKCATKEEGAEEIGTKEVYDPQNNEYYKVPVFGCASGKTCLKTGTKEVQYMDPHGPYTNVVPTYMCTTCPDGQTVSHVYTGDNIKDTTKYPSTVFTEKCVPTQEASTNETQYNLYTQAYETYELEEKKRMKAAGCKPAQSIKPTYNSFTYNDDLKAYIRNYTDTCTYNSGDAIRAEKEFTFYQEDLKKTIESGKPFGRVETDTASEVNNKARLNRNAAEATERAAAAELANTKTEMRNIIVIIRRFLDSLKSRIDSPYNRRQDPLSVLSGKKKPMDPTLRTTLDKMITELEGTINAEEKRTGITDPGVMRTSYNTIVSKFVTFFNTVKPMVSSYGRVSRLFKFYRTDTRSTNYYGYPIVKTTYTLADSAGNDIFEGSGKLRNLPGIAQEGGSRRRRTRNHRIRRTQRRKVRRTRRHR